MNVYPNGESHMYPVPCCVLLTVTEFRSHTLTQESELSQNKQSLGNA